MHVFQVVFVKNRGVLVGGESIEEAFHLLHRVMNAIDTQVCIEFTCNPVRIQFTALLSILLSLQFPLIIFFIVMIHSNTQFECKSFISLSKSVHFQLRMTV